jgi:hypothetical protein
MGDSANLKKFKKNVHKTAVKISAELNAQFNLREIPQKFKNFIDKSITSAI